MKAANCFVNFKSERGSAMVLALTSVALIGLMASATMTVAGIMSAESQKRSQFDLISNFSQALEVSVTNRYACLGTSNGNGDSQSGNTLAGLRFSTSSGGLTGNGNRTGDGAASGNGNGNQFSNSCSETCLQRGTEAGGNKLNVSLGTPAGVVRAGFENDDLVVSEFYLRKVTSTGSAASRTASGELIAIIKTKNPLIAYAPRLIGKVNMQLTNGTLTDCNAAPSAQLLCEQMDCVYNPDVPAGAQRCTCGFPNLECSGGKFIAGYDPQRREAICVDVGLNCATSHGPGYFFAGIDNDGRAICLAAEGGYSNPPPPVAAVVCPAGSSQTGTGGLTNVANCRCDMPTQTFNSITGNCENPPVGQAVACVETITEIMCSLGGGGCETRACSSLRSGTCSCALGGAGAVRSWGSGGGGTACEGGGTYENIIYAGTPEAASCPGGGGTASCTAGSERLYSDFDGEVGQLCSQAECVGVNYISPTYGGTGQLENFIPCSQASPGQECFSTIRYNTGNCSNAAQCEIILGCGT